MSVNDEMSYRQGSGREFLQTLTVSGERYKVTKLPKETTKKPETIPWHNSLPESAGVGHAGAKHDGGKPPMQLVPLLAVNEVAKVLGFGARKYAEHNWRKGLSQGRLLGAALRHQVAYLEGEDNDPESELAHLAHAACCVLFALDNHLRGRAELDDRYKHPKK